MIGSRRVAGRQDITPGRDLVYGQSVTDACVAWDDTLPMLCELAEAAARRRTL